MDRKEVEIVVYGAEQVCASCVNLPSAKETCEWLDAAISRKYADQPFKITYVDILNPDGSEDKVQFAKKVIEEDMFYPVVLIGEEIVAEGNVKLKSVYREMEKYGYTVNE